MVRVTAYNLQVQIILWRSSEDRDGGLAISGRFHFGALMSLAVEGVTFNYPLSSYVK